MLSEGAVDTSEKTSTQQVKPLDFLAFVTLKRVQEGHNSVSMQDIAAYWSSLVNKTRYPVSLDTMSWNLSPKGETSPEVQDEFNFLSETQRLIPDGSDSLVTLKGKNYLESRIRDCYSETPEVGKLLADVTGLQGYN